MLDIPVVPLAFDQQSGVVVAIVEDQTWTFDVETLRWTQRSAADFGPGRWFWTRLVYDSATDLTVAITENGSTYVYDSDHDRWTQRTSLPNHLGGVAALDTLTNRIVVLGGVAGQMSAWSYAVVDDTWEELRLERERWQSDHSPLLIGYAPAIEAFVAVNSGAAARTFDPSSGVWERIDTNDPNLTFTWGDLASGTEMVYAPVTGRLIVFTEGVTAEYDPAGQRWATFPSPKQRIVDDMNVGPLVRFGASLVYDSTHERVLMYGGRARMPRGWTLPDDVWAYDPRTHEWSVLLEARNTVTLP